MNYRAFYPNASEFVATADPKAFPLRDSLMAAVKDVQDAWHKGHIHGNALHLVPYSIDENGTVEELKVTVHRRTTVERITA